MKIHISADLPESLRKTRSYAGLTATLKTHDGWVAVSTDDITGATKAQKQTAIHAACERAGLQVETRTDTDQVFVRKLKPLEVQDDSRSRAPLPISLDASEADSAAGGPQ